ncbi:substrate-binding domain-containing protein [Aquihabitans sp. McL0605]|uniref:substrate-binding domain-containing protein n=1 Tax=Aquihabitans sp. McL0605 TaxID=3415671 RepID=UPI003CEEF024
MTPTIPAHQRRVKPAIIGVVAVSLALLVGLPGSASGTVPPRVLTAAGADATDAVSAAILKNYATNPKNTNGDVTANIPALPSSPFTVPADSLCEARTYVVAGSPPATYTAPNSHGAGKTALKDPTNLANGCIDIGRGSSAPAVGDPAAFRFFGFAKDALSWSAYSGGKAPAALTKSQLKGVYDCTYTDWSEVGGKAGHIQRYFTQAGSGAGKVFQTNLLDGFDPTTVSSATCPAVIPIQQSHANLIATAERPYAIFPFSTGDWVAEANGVSANNRAGFTVRSLTVSGVKQNPVLKTKFGKYVPNEAVLNGGYPGTRTVYFVLDTDSVAYSAALAAVGFDANNPVSGVRSPLCNGDLASTLRRYGFLPLAPDANGVTCTLSTI